MNPIFALFLAALGVLSDAANRVRDFFKGGRR